MLSEIIILLLLLVTVLIFLGRKNSKLLEKINVLEKTIEMKAESIARFKTIYTNSLKAIEVHDAQVEEIKDKGRQLDELRLEQRRLQQRIEDKEKTLDVKQKMHDKEIEELTQKMQDMQEDFSAEKEEMGHLRKIYQAGARERQENENAVKKLEQELAQSHEKYISDTQKIQTMLDEKSEAYGVLEKRYGELLSRADALQADLAQKENVLETEHLTSKKQKSKRDKETEHLRSEIEERDSTIAKLEKMQTKSKEERLAKEQALEKALEIYKEKVIKAEAYIEAVDDKLAKEKGKSTDVQAALDQTDEKYHALKDEYTQDRESFKAREDELLEKLRGIQRDLVSSIDEATQSKVQIATEAEEKAKLNEQLDELQKSIVQIEKEYTLYKEKALQRDASLSKDIAEKETYIKTLVVQLESLKKETDRQKEHDQGLLAQRDEALALAQSEYVQMVQQKEEALRYHKEKADEEIERSDYLAKEMQQLSLLYQTHKHQTEERFAQHTKEYHKMKDEVGSLRETLSVQQESSKQSIHLYEKNLEEKEKAYQVLLAEHETQSAVYEKEYQSLQQSLQTLQHNHIKMLKEGEEEKHKLQTILAQRDVSLQEKEEMMYKLQRLAKEKETLETKQEKLVREKEVDILSYKEALEKLEKEKQDEKEKYEALLDTKINALKKMQHDTQERESGQKKRIEHLERVLKLQEQQLSALLTEQREMLENADREQQQAQMEIERLQQQVAQEAEMHTVLQGKYLQKETALQQQLEESQVKLNQLSEHMKTSQAEITALNDALRTQKAAKQTLMSELQNDREAIEKREEHFEMELKALNHTIAQERQKYKDSLKEKDALLAKMSQERAQEIEHSVAEIKALQSAYSQKEKEVRQLHSQITLKEGKTKAQEAEIEKKTRDFEAIQKDLKDIKASLDESESRYQKSLKKSKQTIKIQRQALVSKEAEIEKLKEEEYLLMSMEIRRLYSKGMSKKKIAKRLDLPIGTVLAVIEDEKKG